jgi:hypothetical protein
MPEKTYASCFNPLAFAYIAEKIKRSSTLFLLLQEMGLLTELAWPIVAHACWLLDDFIGEEIPL